MHPLSGFAQWHVDQVAVLVPDLEAAMNAYIASFGVAFRVFEANERTSRFSGSSPHFRIRIAVALAGLVVIELIQPVSGVTLYSEHLQSRGPGLHHIGVHVPDLARARKKFESRGHKPVLDGSIRGLGKFAYFQHPGMHCILESLQLSASYPLFLAANAQPYKAPAS